MVPGDIGTSMLHRRFANLSLNQDVRIRTFEPHKENPNCYLTILTLQVDFVKKQTETKEQFDMGEMKDLFIQFFDEQIFTEKQTLLFEFHGEDLILEVTGVTLVDFNGAGSQPDTTGGFRRGILMKDTVINFVKSATSSIRLVGGRSTSAPTALLQPNFSFEDLGIGGLDHEFSQIFRRAFASRIFPPHVVEKLGIQHVKGVLLYGPPGTGKTLMARQIGKMLNAREPQIVNGPEILNKYVGQSEENVRKLFAEAEKEYKARGEESSLHIIIFDELDAICKQRGSTGGGTGVGDSVVNQLLAKMDGVEQLNNILIIGMTNRLDMIDEALLRPGRLEIHMEISLPDEKGRVQILNVHTAKMRNGNLLKDDVNLEELARLTKNFSGAEIAGLVKSATSFAFNRHIKVGATVTVDADYDKIKIGMDDFLGALEEVHPAFGVAETELQQCVANGIIQYSKDIGRILSDGKLFVKQVQDSKVTPLVSVLLHGPPRSGKTALAAEIAMTSDFPFIKLISPETMVGFTEQAKMATINKVFNDAYKSPFSVIVIDAIERLLDYVAVGPRFSNNVLQTLLVLLKKVPQKNHRLLILGTTSSRRVLEEMELTDAFNEEIYVRNVEDLQGVDMVLRTLAVFGDRERDRSIQTLRSAGLESRIGVGIKRLIMMADMASRDEDKVDKFVTLMADQGVRASLEEAPKRGGFGIQGPSDQGDYAAGGVLQSYS
ncbi:transport between ER and Golgi ATPase protein [Rhizophlyctis rosea]|uniref:Vesicular-fusion protein SEC18 n=1 Tax=Rhizophlyctis rosea TaxID=64517 RepID=A0AAD5X3U2_9FUNG|nr:transport between ER and Golgi ATPase protein [Rhizophlyctis rosea]